MSATTAFISLQETIATQSGQRQFKVLSSESLNGFSKVAQYATHFVQCDSIAKIQMMCGVDSTFTFFTLFENAASPYYLGNATKLMPAEGLIFFMEVKPGFFKLLKGYDTAATHFMWTMLATACEMSQKSDQETVYPAEFLSIFKKNAHERSVLEPIDKLPQEWKTKVNTPGRAPRFVISLKKSMVNPDLMCMMPLFIMPTEPDARCDYYLEGTDHKEMYRLANKLRWNPRTKGFAFSIDDILKVVSDLKVEAALFHKNGTKYDDIQTPPNTPPVTEPIIDISDDDDEIIANFHAAAQIVAEVKENTDLPQYVATEAEKAEIEAAAVESNTPMWYLFFVTKFYDGATHVRSAFVEDSPDVDKPELYWRTESTDKALLEAIFRLTTVYMKLPELIENLNKNGLTLESCSFSPSSPTQEELRSLIPVQPEPVSPASPPPALFDDLEPDSPPENEVIYVMLDYNTKSEYLTPVRQIRGPIDLMSYTYDFDYYLRFPDMGDGLDFFAKYQNKPLERAEIEADIKAMYICPGGLQELPKIDDFSDDDSESEESFDDSIVKAVLEVASRKRTERCSDTPVSQPKRARGRRMTEIERLRADAVAFKLVPQ